MMKRFSKKENLGITLIALVITIVVLIILATVAINLSLGNNGIFNRAKTAKEQYQNAQEYEQIESEKITNKLDNYIDGNRESYYMIPDYQSKVSILDYSSNANQYTVPKDGYLLLPCILMKNGGDMKLYIDDFMVAYICEDGSYSRNSIMIPVASNSRVYYVLTDGGSGGTSIISESNGLWFVPCK